MVRSDESGNTLTPLGNTDLYCLHLCASGIQRLRKPHPVLIRTKAKSPIWKNYRAGLCFFQSRKHHPIDLRIQTN
jgi:hypothetical protein